MLIKFFYANFKTEKNSNNFLLNNTDDSIVCVDCGNDN